MLALLDACGSKGDFAGNEGFATALALVIEEDARAAIHVVSLAIFLYYPESILLSNSVWAVRVERSVLVLWHFLYLAIELGGGSLIDAARILETKLAHSLEDAQYTYCIDVGSELRRVEADLHVALSSEVVDFAWTNLADNAKDAHRVTQVGIVEVEVWGSFKMCDTLAIVDRRTTDCAVDFVSFFQKEFCKVRTILTRDTCNKSYFIFHVF